MVEIYIEVLLYMVMGAEFFGPVNIRNAELPAGKTTIHLMGGFADVKFPDSGGYVWIGGNGSDGELVLFDKSSNIDTFDPGSGSSKGIISLRTGASRSILVRDLSSPRKSVLEFSSDLAQLNLGAHEDDGGGKAGKVAIRNQRGMGSIFLNGVIPTSGQVGIESISVRQINDKGNKNIFSCAYSTTTDRPGTMGIYLGSHSTDIGVVEGDGIAGLVAIRNTHGNDSIVLNGGAGAGLVNIRNGVGNDSIVLNGGPGLVNIRNGVGNDSIVLNGTAGVQDNVILVRDNQNKRVFAFSNETPDNKAKLFIGAHSTDTNGNKPGEIVLRDVDGNDSIVLDGGQGDIFLNNADCAEEFDISSESPNVERGSVMVIEDDGRLKVSSKPYDKRVAGVISGAGNCKPGIVLDRKEHSSNNRLPIALVGKVFCKVDAQYSAIEVGDILTTSETRAHAMKATDHVRAFGAVIGKALQTIKSGKGLVPILIALQ